MCYINGVKVSLQEFIRYKQHQKEVLQLTAAKLFYQPAKRCFDYTEWPVIRIDGHGEWDAVPMEWGIIPPWIKTRQEATQFRIMYPTYNAVGSALFDKKTYATPARKYRCLVPSTGFYEYMHMPKIGKKGQPLKAVDKIPFYTTVPGQPLFYMAGIYSPWFDNEKDDWINTFSILTADAGELMAKVHNIKKRQPTILPPALAERWTDKDLTDKEITEIGSWQFDNHLLKVHTVNQQFWNDEDPSMEVHYDNVPELI